MAKNQKGFVSIITASTIMIILALVTIGFTQLVQREQRQSLDRQLSRQALYAAESGINQTFFVLSNDPDLDEEKLEDCNPSIGGINPVIDEENDVEYTCILYDKNPTKLSKAVGTDSSWLLELSTFSGNEFSEVTIQWGNSDPAQSSYNEVSSLPTCANAREFRGSRNFTIPVLKFDMTNLSTLGRDSLISNSAYMYLSPCRQDTTDSVTSYNFRGAIDGDNVIPVSCDGGTGTAPCSVTIIIDDVDRSNNYLARIKPIYTSAFVEITGSEIIDTTGVPTEAEFADQYSIDVTARSSDVIRRLRATVPLSIIGDKPETVFHSFTEVCKLIDVNYNPSAGQSAIVDGC